MRLKMAPNSLFAILLRSPWWVSLLVAALIVAAAYALLPPAFALGAALGAAPFVIIAGIAGWRQLQAPSAEQIRRTHERVAAMGWHEFSAAIEQAFRNDGYTVRRLERRDADLEATKDEGRYTTLIACKRWKAARVGVEPLRELQAARELLEARDCVYVALGELSDNARSYAATHRIRVLQAPELARLLRGLAGSANRTALGRAKARAG